MRRWSPAVRGPAPRCRSTATSNGGLFRWYAAAHGRAMRGGEARRGCRFPLDVMERIGCFLSRAGTLSVGVKPSVFTVSRLEYLYFRPAIVSVRTTMA